jgi:hypothetical protein
MNRTMLKTNDELIMDYISGQLCTEDIEIFEHNLTNNPKLQEELHEAQKAYDLIVECEVIEVPEISQSMDKGFYQMLNDEKSKQKPKTKSIWSKLLNNSFLKPVFYGSVMLMVGFLMGNLTNQQKNNQPINENNIVSTRYNKMQDLAVVSMLQLPSASKRLQAVSLVDNSNKVDDVVISALFETLNNDGNTNVRLAVLDALIQFSNTPKVRAQLVNSISNQNSPLVQVAIAELMLHLQESKAIKPLKELLDNKDLIEPAREKILFAVNKII